MSPGERRASVAVALVALSYGVFGALFEPRQAVVAWLITLAVSCPILFVAARAQHQEGPDFDRKRFVRLAVIGAVALRVGALAAPVSLSDDIYRYAWDGTLLIHGEDPYATRPREVAGTIEQLNDEALHELNSPDYYTVYPPVAQLTFGLGAAIGLTGLPATVALRVLFIAADIGSVVLILLLLSKLERPLIWGLAYAWNPCVVWEVAAGGHTEVLAVPLLLYAFLLSIDGRALRAGLAFGLAICAKFSVFVLSPVWLVFLVRRHGMGALVFAGATVLAVSATTVPFYSETLAAHVSESVALYSETFAFNGPVYYAMRAGLRYAEGWSASVDPWVMPWLTAATLIWLALSALATTRDPARAAGLMSASFVGYLLLSRVLHPWYILPVLAFGVLARSRSIVVLSLVLALSYLRYDPLGYESKWVIIAQLVAFVIAWSFDALLSGRVPQRGV